MASEEGYGREERDSLAYDLVQTDFDAVERGGYRARWTRGDAAVAVEDLESRTTTVYDAEDLVRATSDREVRSARTDRAPD